MRTLVYALGDGPWQIVVQCQQAGLLRANLLYYAGNTSGSISLRPQSVGKSETAWHFPGSPEFEMVDIDQNAVQVALNADGGNGTAELLYLELQHWEDPFDATGIAKVSIDVRQGDSSLDLHEVVVSPSGPPVTKSRNGPYVFKTPASWREAALYFSWGGA